MGVFFFETMFFAQNHVFVDTLIYMCMYDDLIGKIDIKCIHFKAKRSVVSKVGWLDKLYLW